MVLAAAKINPQEIQALITSSMGWMVPVINAATKTDNTAISTLTGRDNKNIALTLANPICMIKFSVSQFKRS